MMRIASEGADAMGLVPYYLYRQKNMAGNLENVGYAKPGKAGIYNILIMEEVLFGILVLIRLLCIQPLIAFGTMREQTISFRE